MTVESTSFDYWWNWRVLICATWVLSSMIIASNLIWKHEGSRREGEEGVYADEAWRTCIEEIHPAWLLAFRIVAFFVLSVLLVVYVIVQGGSTLYYYTQWTFTMVTLYFAVGSVLSLYGCHQDLNEVGRDVNVDAERGTYVAPNNDREICGTGNGRKNSGPSNQNQTRRVAGAWGYAFQILYQTNAGAVLLTDIVFWLIIVPFLAIEDYELNLLTIAMHSLNAVFLLGDAALNSMIPMVSDIVFPPMDFDLCHLSVDHSRLHLDLVALPIFGSVFQLCAIMVPAGGIVALAMLCHFPPLVKTQALITIFMVPTLLPINQIDGQFRKNQCRHAKQVR